jgi:hypothetical protein
MLLEDPQPIGFARITIIFCLFAHLNNLNKFCGLSRYVNRLNQKCYIEVYNIDQRGRSDDRPHGRPGRQGWRSRFPSPQGKALGALGEELEAPTKAGAAPPRRGLPDEGGGASGPLLVRREPPLEG